MPMWSEGFPRGRTQAGLNGVGDDVQKGIVGAVGRGMTAAREGCPATLLLSEVA